MYGGLFRLRENAQSMPDILLLPRLAVFFGVTIDELIGYEAQLSREQIRRCYGELSKDFVNLPFDEAAQKVRVLRSCGGFSLAHSFLSKKPKSLKKSSLPKVTNATILSMVVAKPLFLILNKVS